ncbi:DCN1-like protein 2 [Eubalaena glacialis]|uniref:DCN1-like protein 2 n=1 Tax=Eubalaena glacialis TaxID=27606 RepID=UPI002A5A0241|nr:DCN1-like protein 2 [Eubalaena glacialis]XP_061026578.1 DCN1-like protein 2 [Eubalaena glacialis]
MFLTCWMSRRDLEVAVAYWNLVLSGSLKFLDLWNIFLLGLAQRSPRSRPAATLCHQLKAAPRGSDPAAPRPPPLDCPPLGPPQLCSRAGTTPGCLVHRSGGVEGSAGPGGSGSFGAGSRLRLRGGCRVRAALTSGGGRAVLLRPPPAREEQPFHWVAGWGLCGKALLEQPGEGPQNATQRRDVGLTRDGRCRRARVLCRLRACSEV